MKYYFKAFKLTFNFTGKASPKQFWYFFFIDALVAFTLQFVGNYFGVDNAGWIYTGIRLLTFVSLGFRRLNDAGLNKFLFLIPLMNIILAAFPSRTPENA